MIRQKIEEISSLLLQLQNIDNEYQELAITKTGKVVTVAGLTRANLYLIDNGFKSEHLTTVDYCKTQLKAKLATLKIGHYNKITTANLLPKLKNKIIAYCSPQSLSISDINEIINNCNNDSQLFMDLLEIKLLNFNLNANSKTKKYNNYCDLGCLSDYLELHIADDTKRILIFNRIKPLIVDDTISTISAIANNLNYEFELSIPQQLGIIKSIYGADIATKFYQHQQKYDSTIEAEKHYQLTRQLQEEQNRMLYQKKYKKHIEIYRSKGLDLANKDTLAIGSKIADTTGSLFDPSKTVFADLKYADLNGNILNTIDRLHFKFKNHNKFKFIAFTGIPGYIFEDIDTTLTLIMKIYDLLKIGGIIYVRCGSIRHCREINSHRGFIDNILVPANFSENEIATLKKPISYKYENCLSILTNDKNEFVDSRGYIIILARKSN